MRAARVEAAEAPAAAWQPRVVEVAREVSPRGKAGAPGAVVKAANRVAKVE